MICPECEEFFDVVTNTYGAGLNYCPCCGHEFSEDDFDKMDEDEEG